jgi:ribosome-binding protein aMBF1 (putative translation factor)
MKEEKNNFRNPDIDVIEKALIEKFGEVEYSAAKERAKFKHELARAVKERRIKLHMDQKELANKLHTTQQQLSRYEVGENSPTAERLYDICKMLDLELILQDNAGVRILNTGTPLRSVRIPAAKK